MESQSAKVKALAQGIWTAGQKTTGFAPNFPAALPCNSLCPLSFPSKARQLRWLQFSCRHTGRALPRRTLLNSPSVWTQEPPEIGFELVVFLNTANLDFLCVSWICSSCFQGGFIYHLNSQKLFFSLSKRFSCNDNSRSWGFKERQSSLRRLLTQSLTFGSSTPLPAAEMLTAAWGMLK